MDHIPETVTTTRAPARGTNLAPGPGAPPAFCLHAGSPLEATRAPRTTSPPPPLPAAQKDRRHPENFLSSYIFSSFSQVKQEQFCLSFPGILSISIFYLLLRAGNVQNIRFVGIYSVLLCAGCAGVGFVLHSCFKHLGLTSVLCFKFQAF